jgi:hypothetical protein
MMIVITNTIIQPYTVVIMSRDAGIAKVAMLAPCRFREETSATLIARVEENSIVWISPHFIHQVFRCDEGLRDSPSI